MDNDQITALAREYAEEKGKRDTEQGFPESFIKDMLEFNEKEFKSVFEFLLKRYNLVEKEAVRKEYQQAIEQGKHALVRCYVESRAKLRLLESLFPEIAKEVEG